MGILNDLLRHVQTVDDGMQTGEFVRNAIINHSDDIMELQRRQLFSGLASNGQEIRPYYSEDLKPSGYFRSKQTAANYSAWKQELDYPYTAKRNPDAPNLYINGKFHSELDVAFNPDTVEIYGSTSYAQKIIAKYGIATFGLMMANWMVVFVDRGAYNELMSEIKSKLYV